MIDSINNFEKEVPLPKLK